MKGDRVEIVVDAGGDSRTYEVNATRAGRRVDVTISRGVATVAEVTRGGTVVRTARFMANRVLALVEQLRWGLAGLLLALAVAGKALRVPSPPRYSPAPFVPPTMPPVAAGPAR